MLMNADLVDNHANAPCLALDFIVQYQLPPQDLALKLSQVEKSALYYVHTVVNLEIPLLKNK